MPQWTKIREIVPMEKNKAEARKKYLRRILVVIAAILLFGHGCATPLYIAAQCSGEPENIVKTNLAPFGNIMLMDCMVINEIRNGPDDYLLPPWLDRSLNTICVCLDFPISFVFDIITFPYQLWRYYHLPPLPNTEKAKAPPRPGYEGEALDDVLPDTEKAKAPQP